MSQFDVGNRASLNHPKVIGFYRNEKTQKFYFRWQILIANAGIHIIGRPIAEQSQSTRFKLSLDGSSTGNYLTSLKQSP